MLKRLSLTMTVAAALMLSIGCGSKKKAADSSAPIGGAEGGALDSHRDYGRHRSF